MWRIFWAGVVATLLILFGAVYFYFAGGYADVRADAPRTAPEQWLGSVMVAGVQRQAPKHSNPIPATEANLVDGARLYVDKCAGCHGSPVNPESDLGKSFNPPAPQFFGATPLTLRPNESFFVIRHGIRMSAMPAWKNIMADSEVWQVIDLLDSLKQLPVAAQQELRKPTAAPAP